MSAKAKVHVEERGGDERWHVSSESLADPKHVHWRDLGPWEKGTQVLSCATRTMALLLVIFAFICTLGLLAHAFKLIGGRGVGNTIKNSPLIKNPVSAAIIGMVITLILESSSTLISILVGMVAGHLISVHQAIPIMLGSEMGASIMNALISLTQSGDRAQFRRAFAAATMNDVYNFLCFLVFLPLEVIASPIERLSAVIVSPLSNIHPGEFKTLNAITDPLLDRIVQIDDAGLAAAALSNDTDPLKESFVLRCVQPGDAGERLFFCPYEHLFAHSTWSDAAIGGTLLAVSVGALVACMLGIVKLMQDLLAGRIAVLLRRLMDKRLPFPCAWLTDYLIMVFGCLVVMVIQSSSVFRSALTPLVGIGVVTLERLYPLIVGSNVGTTFTGVLAALSADPARLKQTLQMALCQTLYNVFGLLLFYPLPCLRRIPISLAMKLGDITAKYRWFALVYIACVFFLVPGALLALSFLPAPAMLSVLGVLLAVLALVVLVNVLQSRAPRALPSVLRSWVWLPLWMRSLQPYDRVMTRYCSRLPCCRKCFQRPQEDEDLVGEQASATSSAARLIRLSYQTQV